MRDSIGLIESFIDGMQLEDFRFDAKTQAAVERKMQIISEAAIRLRDRADELCPGLPWRDIRGMGNWLRHQYDFVDLDTVWNTIQDDLPRLKMAILPVLARMEAQTTT
ncbi:DUF86 domain-containing protein [Telmatobacter bradus]|uniref:HepT-like ribonuclease domain-containing protein n=1 Tax=Telmatobacter bradus TaxID=474953 RepID=UPI003B42C130